MTVFTIGWILLALINIAYGLMIRAIGSGTSFFLVWIGMGAGCIVLAIAAQLHLWGRLPGVLRVLIMAGAGIALVILLLLVSRIRSGFGEKGKPGLSYLIVLGAQMNHDGPSAVLEYRLEEAARYLEENPKTYCIVTGGKGYNEPCTEAEGMENWLVEHGIERERIIREEKSTNTVQNIRNAMEILAERETKAGAESKTGYAGKAGNAAIVTNNFHLYRAVSIAKKQGLQNVTGIAAYSTARYLPNNVFREVLGVAKDVLCGNMEL